MVVVDTIKILNWIWKSIVEIRRSNDRLISTMGFPTLARYLYIESGLWSILPISFKVTSITVASHTRHDVTSHWRLFVQQLIHVNMIEKHVIMSLTLLNALVKQPRIVWVNTWWRHEMMTFSALLTNCVENSLVTGEFPTQRPMTRSFDVFFDLCLIKRLSKQSWGWWFETPSGSLWRHCNENMWRH